MDMDHPSRGVVVYGDNDTLENHADRVHNLAQQVGFDIKAWHSDPEGTRVVDTLDRADGLVSALSDCGQLRAGLLVPYPMEDMPGQQTWRLIAHWLHCHGLRLYLGPAAFYWERPVDEFDFAVRRTLDASYALDVAVVARGAVPTMEVLLDQITGQPVKGHEPVNAQVLDAEPQFRKLRMRRDADLAAGLHVPAPPDPASPWPERRLQTRAFASWLQRHASQSVIAEVLNATGVRPHRGDHWTQPMVSRLLRQGSSPRRDPDAA
jgi:hypothetical protein